MELNWAETWTVNNPLRVLEQRCELRWFKKTRPVPPGSRILEVGCGRGAGARLILKTFLPSEMDCQDLDIRMIKKALRYLSSEERARVRFHVGDAVSLPFREGTMDAVFGFGVLHHVPDWRAALGEISRVLKPGGIYFIEELYPSLYQNFITKHILLHPRKDRFKSHDLLTVMAKSNFSLLNSLENTRLGILAVAEKGVYPGIQRSPSE